MQREPLVEDRDVGVVVVHEVLGVNAHIHRMAQYFGGHICEVYTPNLLDTNQAYSRRDEAVAYRDFNAAVGISRMAERLHDVAHALRSRHRRVNAVGFSVGATSAWLAARTGVFDAAVCLYGSRIRDHVEVTPKCETLLIFAADEPNFDPEELVGRLSRTPGVTATLVKAGHGFCDPESPNYVRTIADEALAAAAEFLELGVKDQERQNAHEH